MSRTEELKTWYLSLEQRERRILAAGSVCLALMLVYLAVLHPFFSAKQALEARVGAQQTLLDWMRPVAAQIQLLRGQQPSGLQAGQSLLSTIDRSAADAGFGPALKQVQTDNDGSVRVQLQGAGFDSLVRWLERLHRQYGISVSELTAQRGSGPGTVDATLILQAPSP
jgi:type II secretory pathway component PulM